MIRGTAGGEVPGASAGAGSGSEDPAIAGLARRLEEEAAALDSELAEIELLIDHAKAEAARHEGKRASASDRLAQRPPPTTAEGRELTELAKQVGTLTRKSAVMDAQIDVLEGKQRALTRYRDAVRRVAAETRHLAVTAPPAASAPDAKADDEASSMQTARSVLGAQEDLRRQIARSLHDGPVQGLTNIALQAQIVERLADRSPAQAVDEAKALVAMVQSTLDTTKSFLFDVRPMVLDDLGLVPTLRRTVRERGARSEVVIALETSGQDQRLAGEIESSLFRIIDDAVSEYLDTKADKITIQLDWMERLSVVVAAARAATTAPDEVEAVRPSKDVPPALAAMIEDRRLSRRPHLSDETWREIRARAAVLQATVDLLDEGAELRLLVPIAGR